MCSARAAALAALLAGCATAAEHRSRDAVAELAPLAPAAPSEAPPPALADLDALLTEAARRSPALRAAWQEAAAAAAALPAARALPEPMVSYSLFLRSVETRVGPQNHRLGVSQALPWPGRLSAAADAAAARVEAALRRLEAQRVELARRVRTPWAERAWLARAGELLADEEALLAGVEEALRSRLRVGRAAWTDVQRVALRRAALREEIATLGDRDARLAARVRAEAGLPAGTPLPPARLGEDAPALPDAAALREALAANPRLQVALSEVAAARADVATAATAGLPGFSLGLDWVAVGPAVMPGQEDSGKDAVMVMAGVKVPLWRGAYRAEEEGARARLLAAEARRDQAALDADAALEDVLSRLAEAERKVRLHEDELVPGTRAALDATLTALAADRGSLLDVLDLERLLLETRLTLARARADRDVARADLEALLGREVPR